MKIAALVACLALAACGSRSEARRYELSGQVVSVDKQQRRVTVSHKEIPGFMPAMTMPFYLKDEWALDVLAAGDTIQATLVVDRDRSWLEDIVITKGGEAKEIESELEPRPGAEVPDFALVNQDGKPIKLRDYRGKALALTFIYTRCPIQDYCPLMSSNFAQIDRLLRKDPALAGRAHLLSISIDPDYDKPEVLRRYGAEYLKESGGDFSHWEFASGAPEQIRAAADFFGLRYWAEGGQIIHSLRTAIIAPDGKLYKLYRDNQWKPEELLNDLKSAANQRGA